MVVSYVATGCAAKIDRTANRVLLTREYVKLDAVSLNVETFGHYVQTSRAP